MPITLGVVTILSSAKEAVLQVLVYFNCAPIWSLSLALASTDTVTILIKLILE